MPEYQLTMFRCKWCAKALTDNASGRKMRADKEFCNRSCRARYSNWKKRAVKEATKASKALHELGKYLDHAETTEDAIELFGGVFKVLRYETKNRGVQIKAVERD